ncbi:MAG TPA: hypothetical protein VLK61_05770, partial [Aquabacterium sp.]|nr:hypothetical protein [Aquabacterium sp.]
GTPEALMYKVVHEVAPPPSLVEGANRTDRFDAVVSTAMSKHPDRRYATAAAFRKAMIAAANAPVSPTVSDETIIALPARTKPSIAGVATSGTGGSLTQWDKSVLAEAEQSLARHVGPMASVMVRRAAKECHDLPSLYAKLAEQVTNPTARGLFIDHAARAGRTTVSPMPAHTTGGRGATIFATAVGSMPTVATNAVKISDAAVEQAQKLLAVHVGPIARVVVKKAAEKSRYRDPFFTLVAEAVPAGPARQKLLAELAKLH